jgi:hypothetical protein
VETIKEQLAMVLADMRRKYLHAKAMGWGSQEKFLDGAPITTTILESWIPVIERTVDALNLTPADYEEVLAGHRRLVRELDVLLNGDGAAKQASLCDVISQLADIKRRCPHNWTILQGIIKSGSTRG